VSIPQSIGPSREAAPIAPAMGRAGVQPRTLIGLEPVGTRRRVLDRSDDRRLTVIGLGLSAVFLAVAIAAVLGEGFGPQPWLPLHLVLAGAATVAIGAVLPYFAAALVAAPSAASGPRIAILVLLVAGACGVTFGVSAAIPAIATGGGLLFISGLAGLLAVTVRIFRSAPGARRRVLTVVYAVAVVNVLVGASIATLFVAGEGDVMAAWPRLMVAHAWLNLFGFVGLVICASLIHLYPTVVGTRMGHDRLAVGALGSLAVAPPTVALAEVLGSDALARVGGIVMLAGTAAMVGYAVLSWRSRGHWTTDEGWHRVAITSLSAGLTWFGLGVGLAVGRIEALGSRPDSWSLTALIAPLGVGFVIQVLIGAWTQLLPSIGPGDFAVHARSRAILGRFGSLRFGLLNGGAAVVLAGSLVELPEAVPAGLALAGLSVMISLALVGGALRIGLSARADTRPATPTGPVRPEAVTGSVRAGHARVRSATPGNAGDRHAT